MIWLKILIIGWGVLIAAIAINLIAARFGIKTWYPFLEEASKNGFTKTLQNTNPVSLIFLLLLYPFILGLVAYFLLKFLET